MRRAGPIHMFDDQPASEGKHGPLGPCHYGTTHVDYEYQAELWVQYVETELPECVRIECPSLGRIWMRGKDGKFVEKLN